MIIVGTKADLIEKREVKLPLIRKMEATWKGTIDGFFLALSIVNPLNHM